MHPVNGSPPQDVSLGGGSLTKQEVVGKFNDHILALNGFLEYGYVSKVTMNDLTDVDDPTAAKAFKLFMALQQNDNKIVKDQLDRYSTEDFLQVNHGFKEFLGFLVELAKNNVSSEELKLFATNNKGRVFTTKELIEEMKGPPSAPPSDERSLSSASSRIATVVSQSMPPSNAVIEPDAEPLPADLFGLQETGNARIAPPLSERSITTSLTSRSVSTTSLSNITETVEKRSVWETLKAVGLKFKEKIGLADKINREHSDYTLLKKSEKDLQGFYVHSQLFPGEKIKLTPEGRKLIEGHLKTMEEIKERRDQGKETEDPRTQMIGTRAEKWIDFIHDELGIQSSRQGAFGSSVRSASSITTPEQAQYDKIEGLIEEVKDLLPGFSPNTTYSPESAREKWGNSNANTQRLNEILKELRSLNATYDDSATILKNKADLLQMTEPLLSSLSIINKALQSNFQI